METNNAEIHNPSHDLFLYPSDNPNNILVNELLNGRNYATWKKSIEIALIAKTNLVLSLVPLPRQMQNLCRTSGIGMTR